MASYKHQVRANLIGVGRTGQSGVEECPLTKSSTSQLSYGVPELSIIRENHEGVAPAQFRRPCEERLHFINNTLGGAPREQWGESPPLNTENAPNSSTCHICYKTGRQPESCRRTSERQQQQDVLQLWKLYNPIALCKHRKPVL